MALAVVKARNVFKLFATVVDKKRFCLTINFLQRFQTLRRKSGTDNIQGRNTLLSQTDNGFIGVGLQPLCAPQTRLKTQLPLILAKLQFVYQQPCGGLAMLEIRVTQVNVTTRNTVERDQ